MPRFRRIALRGEENKKKKKREPDNREANRNDGRGAEKSVLNTMEEGGNDLRLHRP